MNIVHYGHACVLLETESARLLFDPGPFSSGFEELTGLDAVLITHQHFDHLDMSRLSQLLPANPEARLFADPGGARALAEHDLHPTVLRPADSVSIAGTSVTGVGGDHAVIHPDIPVIPNVGYLVDHGAFYHPGDAFFVPAQEIDVLALPTGGPWLKLWEAVDFLREIGSRVAVPIHEAILASPEFHYRVFEDLAPAESAVKVLDRGKPAEV